ncbi:amidohydrolase [Arthrobacter sp. KNU-44]|uniref:amidohydrolase n=1 Tax=Arthrobacter sp. KNU-44 TaxID=3450744 RepID=UPI003F42D4A7
MDRDTARVHDSDGPIAAEKPEHCHSTFPARPQSERDMSMDPDHRPFRTHYRNATVFTATDVGLAESVVVEGDRLAWVGDTATAERMAGPDALVIDLDGAFVSPGLIDAHTHLLMLGQALQKIDLLDAANLAEIQQRLLLGRREKPQAKRILGRSWLFSQIPDGAPTHRMIDEVIVDIPVYLYANDFHSVWVNSAAIAELGITRDTPDPLGGRIGRDPQTGEPNGMIYEAAAAHFVRPVLAGLVTDTERDEALQRAFDCYLSAGVTGAVDMAVSDHELQALQRALLASNGKLPIRVVGHWRVSNCNSVAENMRQVEEAARLSQSVCSPWLRIAGIKIVIDGVIDACTATMKEPYADGSNAKPIWNLESLIPVVTAADSAGLQIAMHAIGDEASEIALTALEHAYRANGARPRRHRIEHLETVSRQNVARLARLGIVASMQPVHSDPAIQDNWRAMLGDDRVERGYPWSEFAEAGAQLAFGTDAPTAPFSALANLYVASTRRSALAPYLAPNVPALALSLEEALTFATSGAAWSCGAEKDLGRLEIGLLADFTVLDTNPFKDGPESLLTARVLRTVVGGETSYLAGPEVS